MKTALLGLLVFFGALCLSAKPLEQTKVLWLGPQRLPVIELSGTPYERGLQHGRALREEIARMLVLWKKDQGDFMKRDADQVIRDFMAWSKHEESVRQWAPALLEEVRGIADGAGQPFELIFAYQCLDELWAFEDIPAKDHCSSLGIPRVGTRPTIVAQTMDLENFRDGSQVLLHILGTESEPEQYLFSSAGMIATNGMNASGFAITCNTLLELDASPTGLPVIFAVRLLLSQRRPEDALALLRRLPFAAGQNYIVGVGSEVHDFEVSSFGLVELKPQQPGWPLLHTNHALLNPHRKPWHKDKTPEMIAADKDEQNSRSRLASLVRHLGKPVSELELSKVQEALGAKDSPEGAVCVNLRPDGLVFTLGATIMVLAEKPYFLVSKGPPDTNAYVRLDFSK